jgi:hypothetical protein
MTSLAFALLVFSTTGVVATTQPCLPGPAQLPYLKPPVIEPADTIPGDKKVLDKSNMPPAPNEKPPNPQEPVSRLLPCPQ